MRYIPAIQVSLTDIQLMHRTLDKRIPASVTLMMEGFVNLINYFEKNGSQEACLNFHFKTDYGIQAATKSLL